MIDCDNLSSFGNGTIDCVDGIYPHYLTLILMVAIIIVVMYVSLVIFKRYPNLFNNRIGKIQK